MKKTTYLFLVLFGATLATVTPSVLAQQRGANSAGATASSLVLQPPRIVRPPVSLVVNSNASAHFVVKATGSALKYQWQLDDVNIVNATRAVLTLTNIAAIDAGVYKVTISNDLASTNAVATLSVTNSPLDFNHDGQTDLLLRNVRTGEFRVWRMNGKNLLKSVSLYPPLAPSLDLRFIDAVGNAMFFQQENGKIGVLDIINNTLFVGGVIGNLETDWTGIAIGNFGSFQLLAQHTDGTVGLSDLLSVTPTAINGTNMGPGWRVVGIADFNDDGKNDILWEDTTGHVTAWLLDGTTCLGQLPLLNGESIGPAWDVVALADFSSDGETDLILENKKGYLAVKYLKQGVLVGSAPLHAGNPIPPAWRIVAPH